MVSDITRSPKCKRVIYALLPTNIPSLVFLGGGGEEGGKIKITHGEKEEERKKKKKDGS